jgi:hypothetical protein
MLSVSAAISEYLSSFSRDRVLNYVGYNFLFLLFLFFSSFFFFFLSFLFYCELLCLNVRSGF